MTDWIALLKRLIPEEEERVHIGVALANVPTETLENTLRLLEGDDVLRRAIKELTEKHAAGLEARVHEPVTNSDTWAAANLLPADVPLSELKATAVEAMRSTVQLPCVSPTSQQVHVLVQPHLFPADGPLAAAVFSALTKHVPSPGTENAMVGWLDALLVEPSLSCAMAVTGGELLCTRNAGDVYIDSSSNKRHTPDKARADLTMSLRGVALARGEDKVASVSHDDAIKQLGKKFAGAYRSRVYGSKITYQLCITCCGLSIRFWALLVPGNDAADSRVLFRDDDDKLIRGLLLTETLLPASSVFDRQQVIRGGLFILRVMAAQQKYVCTEFVLRLNRTRIEFFQDHVFKTVHAAEGLDADLPDAGAMKAVYGLASNAALPSLVQLHGTMTRGNPGILANANGRQRYEVRIKPAGHVLEHDHVFLNEDVKRAARCILSALVPLHAGNWTHADLRAPNIVLDGDVYVLIDLEGALERDTKPPPGLQRPVWGPYSEALQGGLHTAAADLWALGALLRNSSESYMHSQDVLAFCDRLQQRPTAVHLDAALASEDPFFAS